MDPFVEEAFDAHRHRQMLRAPGLMHEQRLRWLDEAKTFAAKALGAARRQGRGPKDQEKR